MSESGSQLLLYMCAGPWKPCSSMFVCHRSVISTVDSLPKPLGQLSVWLVQ